MSEKYDISKTYKLGESHLRKVAEIADKKNFKTDSEVVRFAINLLYSLYKKDLLTETVSKVLEQE